MKYQWVFARFPFGTVNSIYYKFLSISDFLVSVKAKVVSRGVTCLSYMRGDDPHSCLSVKVRAVALTLLSAILREPTRYGVQ